MKKGTLSGVTPKRNLIVEIFASILLIFFVHTLVSSYIQLQSLKNLLAFYTHNTALVAGLIIIAETIVAALIFFPRTRLIGFVAALLLVSFAGLAILLYPHYPHDFGGLFNSISKSQKWILIISIIAISAAGIIATVLKGRLSRKQADITNVVYT